MKRNTVAVVTTVSTMMLGAGWAAGVVGAAANAGPGGLSIDALGSGNGVVGSTLAPSPTATGTSGSPSPAASASVSPSAAPADPAAAAPAPAAPAPAAPAPAAPPPPPAGVSGTFDGALVNTAQGPFQAEIVVSNKTITAVNVLVGGDSRGDSVAINSYALPTLQQRVLSAQTWNVQGISGASYTVQGFLTSVKDAMARAGLA